LLLVLVIYFISSCASEKSLFNESFYSEKVDIEISLPKETLYFQDVYIVTNQEGLVVFTHNLKTYYFNENYEIIEK